MLIDRITAEDVDRIIHYQEIDDFRGRHLLITGGSGFIGSWISDVLLGLEARITCLDNLSTGKRENIDHLSATKNFNFVKGDVCTYKVAEDYDYIIHLASRASPEEYQQHPIETLRASSFGSHNMLELARKCDARILFTSTSEIYGNAEMIPTPESYWGKVNPVGPRSCYDEGKRFAEALFRAYQKEYGLDVRIARVFNTYGPRIRADGPYARVVSRFITQALTDQPLTVYGDGTQTRSFCYISDTVSGLMTLLINKRAKGEIFNIGDPSEMTILQLARKIKQLTASRSSITFHSLPEDDPKRRCPNIEKARKLLGWKPKLSLKKGLERTAEWFRSKM